MIIFIIGDETHDKFCNKIHCDEIFTADDKILDEFYD